MLRFAPSPTGDMHIANLRIAILNYLVSQQKNEQFLVRIEDTESKHNIEGKDSEIMQILEKFALKHDSLFHQSEHLNLYQTLGVKLLKEKKAFVCKCTNVEDDNCTKNCAELTAKEYSTLKASKEKFVIRIQKSPNMEAFVILKRDGTPTYNFACATDDMMSNIDFVIRDEKYLVDTPKQIHIKNLLGYDQKTTYVHIPTILDLDESTSLQSLFEQGFIPDAILNYLLLLGNANTPKEIFTLPEAIKWFDLNSISKSPAKFEMTKLRFINREHLKLMDDKRLSTLFGFADVEIGKLAKVYLKECSTIKELKDKIDNIFTSKNFDLKWGKEMRVLEDIIFNAPAFETFDEFIEHLISQSDLKDENLFKPLSYLLTNKEDGSELSEIYPFIKSYILEVAS